MNGVLGWSPGTAELLPWAELEAYMDVATTCIHPERAEDAKKLLCGHQDDTAEYVRKKKGL